VHQLLALEADTPAEAVQACGRFLASRWRRWRLARRFLPREARDDLAVLCAWHGLSRLLLEAPADVETARRARDELANVLDTIQANEPRTPMGIALAPVVRRYAIPDLLLRSRLLALERDAHVHTYETRKDLVALARRVAHPEGRLLLRILGFSGERNELLADALATGVQLTSWIAGLRPALDRGHLYLPVEDLVRFRVDLRQIEEGRTNDASRRLIAEEIAWARSFLAKGWPLCEALGPWRGRLLACVLRWHAAALSAVEARDHDALSGPPRAGWPRLLACATASLAGRGLPW